MIGKYLAKDGSHKRVGVGDKHPLAKKDLI
jgi:hypothetical protein